jgi:hypothetical protein
LESYDSNNNYSGDLNVKLYKNGTIEFLNVGFIDINGNGQLNKEDLINIVYSDFVEQ